MHEALQAASKMLLSVELGDLTTKLYRSCHRFNRAVIQWIPSHCNIPGNEEAESLAKEGEKQEVYKSIYRTKWETEHTGYNEDNAYYQLNRKELVTIFRLSTC